MKNELKGELAVFNDNGDILYTNKDVHAYVAFNEEPKLLCIGSDNISGVSITFNLEQLKQLVNSY